MEFAITCDCGKTFLVSAGMAGSSVQCSCGLLTPVPSLSELGRHAPVKDEPERVAPHRSIVAQAALWMIGSAVFGGFVVGGSVLAFAAGGPAGFAYLLSMTGQVWLLALIIRESPPEAIFYALVVPFFTWYFAYERWEVAKWPFVLHAAGIVLTLLAAL
jgi:hypothetical protein